MAPIFERIIAKTEISVTTDRHSTSLSPDAESSHDAFDELRRTGMFFPGMPVQRTLNRYAKDAEKNKKEDGELLECRKYSKKGGNLAPGAAISLFKPLPKNTFDRRSFDTQSRSFVFFLLGLPKMFWI